MIEVVSGTNSYRIIKKVAEAKNYHLYLCIQVSTERQCLLQIASEIRHNGELQLGAYILKELENYANRLEDEYESVKTDSNVLLNYGLGFTELVDSFNCPEQGGRWVNILAFRNVKLVSRMVPVINVKEKDHQLINLRTSAWIMGKLLKVLAFAHSQGISVGLLTGNNILIEPDEHYVVIFDWLSSKMYPEEVPLEITRREISQAAMTVIDAAGGDLETGSFPDSDDHSLVSYTEHLFELARGKENSAERAHSEFYNLIDSLWKREFYPFTLLK